MSPRTVLVTGSSNGIGRTTAVRLDAVLSPGIQVQPKRRAER